jgi:bilin biosynthesis protein
VREPFIVNIMHENPIEVPEIEQLFADLSHPNPYIQTQAFTAMVQYWPEESMSRLLGLLDQQDVALRRASVRALGVFGEAALLPLASLYSSSDDGTTRASCIKAYAQVASNYPGLPFPDESMQALQVALADESPVVAVAAVMALGQVGEQATSILLQVIEGSNPALAVAAVNALAQISHPSVEHGLQALLDNEDTDSYVRETVISALLRVQDIKARQPQPYS